MTTLEIPPPPKNCTAPHCHAAVRVSLSEGIARCSRGHRFMFDREKGVWRIAT